MYEPLMLNIENKYKAFHISFYPHTSLTAGLIFFFFFWENISFQEGREDANTHLHMQMNMSIPAINQKSKLQYHQSPSMRREEERKKKKKSSYSNLSTCARSFFWAGSCQRWMSITVLRMEYHTLHNQMPPLWTQTRGPLEILHLLQMSDFWC